MTSVKSFDVGGVRFGGPDLFLIAGPCVAESRDLCMRIAEHVQGVCSRLGVGYVFKASFDKANRTSVSAKRGPGLHEGLAILGAVKEAFGVPVLTDVHETVQVPAVADVCDVLQIPAFLCRQTDLVLAAANTGRAVNVKKGQWLSPWDAENIVRKVETTGNGRLMLTERGTEFGYNNLVVDYRGFEVMRGFGWPLVFDATHSAQLPGGAGTQTGGMRGSIPAMVRAAMAVGCDGLFVETHPDPDRAWSDPATQWPLDRLEDLLKSALAIRRAAQAIQAEGEAAGV
jgi:2-dehydro-3-deoxyphosphooctonate aldolase (KDO 8-P synthase)